MTESNKAEANAHRVTDYLRKCQNLRDAWTIVDDLGELELPNGPRRAISTRQLSNAIEFLMRDLEENLEPGETVVVKNNPVFTSHKKQFPRYDGQEYDVQGPIGNLSYRASNEE